MNENEEAAFQSYTLLISGKEPGLGWKDVLASRIVVILGEPGSGKTWELRNQTNILRKQHFSFFIPLERLVEAPIEESLHSNDIEQFSKWKKRGGEVIFFLDSVDEAKFRKQKDFAQALDNFVRGVGTKHARLVRIVISSRITEWRVHADREELLQRFGSTLTRRANEEGESIVKTPEFHVVQIMPLDRSRVHKFTEGIGLENPEAFIDEIDSHHAWQFVRRPNDVADLINYWNEHGRFGTLSELIEFNLTNKLKETSERMKNDPLSPQQSRLGAECLGAAVHLCKCFNFFVPDTIPVTDTSSALVAEECLPTGWTPSMCRAILNRPVFDSASYGCIRFHHRRIAEYLGTSWLEQRMKEGCPYPDLEDLLFASHDGHRIIRPSLKPFVAWLALGTESWNLRLRKQIIETAPDLFLTHGDAESLPVEYKYALLQSLIARYRGRERIYVDTEDEALSRMADKNMAPQISTLLRERTNPLDIRIMLLRMIQHGKLLDCLDVVLDIVDSPDESDTLKSYAVASIRDIADQNARKKLAEITYKYNTIKTRLCALICEAIYPHILNPKGLATLLSKAERVARRSVDLPWHLKKHLQDNLPIEQASEMLQVLIDLAQKTPHLHHNNKETPISERFYWLGEVIPVALISLLNWQQLDDNDVEIAARALWLLGFFQKCGKLDRDLPGNLNSLLDKHPAVRRAYVWECINEMLRTKPAEELSPFLVFYHFDIVTQREADIEWLIKDIQEASSQEIKNIALKIAVHLWLQSGRKRSVRKLFKSAIKGNHELVRLFKKESTIKISNKIRSFLYRHRIYSMEQTVRNSKNMIRQCYSKLRDKMWLYWNLQSLRNGTAIYALYRLVIEITENTNQWGADSGHLLRRKRGGLIARAAIAGWKFVWHQWRPPLPHEKPKSNATDYRVIIGLSGLNTSLADGSLDFSMITPLEANLACRYALNELNGFAVWLPELAKCHPDIVRAVLIECICGEWQIPADREHVNHVLSSIRYDKGGMGFLVADDILKKLQDNDPPHYDVLETAIFILMRLSDPPRLALSALASQRTSDYQIDDPRFILWMIVWIQLDSVSAIKTLKDKLDQMQEPTSLIIEICNGLSSHSHLGYPLIEKPDYLRTEFLLEFIPMVFHYIRVEDDIDRTNEGVYSPTSRDHAQDFRNSLIERFSRLSDPEVNNVLRKFLEDPIFIIYRDYILHLIEKRSELSSELIPWRPKDIHDFMYEHETSPHSDYELFKIACKRFSSIKDEVERGEISSRYDLHPDDKEPQLRSWLARQLRNKSRERYTVPQEEVIDLEQKPDLRIEASGIGPVSIEIKWVDNWSLNELKEGLEDQLIGKYLRAPDSNYGIYVLGYKGEKSYWVDDESNQRLLFDELVRHFEELAEAEVKHRNYVIGLRVFGINFQKPPASKI
jgi:hypothetical protein